MGAGFSPLAVTAEAIRRFAVSLMIGTSIVQGPSHGLSVEEVRWKPGVSAGNTRDACPWSE